MQCEVAGRTLGSYETASGLPLARLVYPISTPARTTNTNKKSRKTDGATGRVRFREDFSITRNGGQVKSAGGRPITSFRPVALQISCHPDAFRRPLAPIPQVQPGA